MSLKEFHVVFISACVLLAAGMAYWGFVQYKQAHDMAYVGASLLSLATVIGLLTYEVWFVKKTNL